MMREPGPTNYLRRRDAVRHRARRPSYDVAADGTIDPITSVLSNGQGAACWLVVSSDGDHAYTANAATANVSRYGIASNGALSLEAGVVGTTAPDVSASGTSVVRE
jgi:6-phosphogluconolactonase (cycloisomerase 2 family)